MKTSAIKSDNINKLQNEIIGVITWSFILATRQNRRELRSKLGGIRFPISRSPSTRFGGGAAHCTHGTCTMERASKWDEIDRMLYAGLRNTSL